MEARPWIVEIISRMKVPEGGRIALLPQKTRKIYSYKQLKKALSKGLRNPAAVPVSSRRVPKGSLCQAWHKARHSFCKACGMA
jgi:hypothetical protein